MDAQQIAEATRDAMREEDRASRLLGIEVVAIGPGSASARMTVREDMVNGHDLCHGGFVCAQIRLGRFAPSQFQRRGVVVV